MLERVGEDSSSSILPSESVSQASRVESKRQRTAITSIWYHFTKNKTAKTVACDYCTKPLTLQKNSGTNTYWDHLETCRSDIYDRAKGICISIVRTALKAV